MDATNASVLSFQPVELPIHCTSCGGALDAQCADWHPDGLRIVQSFACPYCSGRNEITLPARLVWVSRRSSHGMARH